jgi:hypothetical protein
LIYFLCVAFDLEWRKFGRPSTWRIPGDISRRIQYNDRKRNSGLHAYLLLACSSKRRRIRFLFCSVWLVVWRVWVLVSFCPWFQVLSFQDISLLAPMLAMLSRDVSEIGARMGFCFTVMGTGLVFLLPIIH